MTKIMRSGGWNVLSLFDGISCGRLALERAGIEVNKYYASEIDKYAIKITQSNYPDTIQLGDVREIDFTQFIGEIDLVIGGSPCQDLSIAKADRKGLDGSRSGLFFKFVEAIETIKPKYFLLEIVVFFHTLHGNFGILEKTPIEVLICIVYLLKKSTILRQLLTSVNLGNPPKINIAITNIIAISVPLSIKYVIIVLISGTASSPAAVGVGALRSAT